MILDDYPNDDLNDVIHFHIKIFWIFLNSKLNDFSKILIMKACRIPDSPPDSNDVISEFNVWVWLSRRNVESNRKWTVRNSDRGGHKKSNWEIKSTFELSRDRLLFRFGPFTLDHTFFQFSKR